MDGSADFLGRGHGGVRVGPERGRLGAVTAPGRGRDDDGEPSFLLHIRRKLLEQFLVGGVGRDVSFGKILAGIDVLRASLLGIVAAKLDQDIVAGVEGIEHFVPAALFEKALERFAGLGVVGDGDLRFEPARELLSPTAARPADR